MRLFAVFAVLFLCGELSFYAQSIDRKIEKSKKDLAFKEKESKRVSSSLYRIADKILNEQKKVKALQEKIASLDENIKEQLSEYELKKKS
jgi:peptidoglycan hydrolase CwlO-like protein